MASSVDSTKPNAFNPPDVPTPPPTYKHVAITPILPTSRLVTLAGQVGVDAATGKAAKGLLEQVRIAYKNVNNCLRSVGATPRDIIHVRHYIVQESGDDAELDSKEVVERGWGPLWIEYMDKEADGHRPPDTVLGVASLAKNDISYEVEVWAIVHA